MQSKTLSSEQTARHAPNALCNFGMMRRNLSGFWPLWAVYVVVWLLALPVAQFSLLFGNSAKYYSLAELSGNSAELLLTMGGQGALWMAGVFGCLFAMALFSYLYSPRSVGMMHSFPIRRGQLFLSNYLTGLAVFLGTQVLAFALAAATQAAAGVLDWRNLLMALGCAAGQMMFFYSFACFCAMFTGQLLALPVFYAILNVLAEGLNALIQNMACSFIYGYSTGNDPEWVIWLTPAWRMVEGVRTQSYWNDELYYSYGHYMGDPSCVAIYAAAGVVFAVLALLVYRTRRSETTGDIITVSWVKPIFCYGMAICFALSLGQLLYTLVWEQFRMEAMASLGGMLVCMILTGLIGFFGAKMLLAKSFRIFRQNWKGAVVLVVILVAFTAGIAFDVTGAERKVPDASGVKSINFSIGGENYCSGNTEDPELIARFCAAHQALIENKDTELMREEESNREDETPYNYGYIDLSYTLENGKSFSRDYNLFYMQDDLENKESATSLLAALACDPEVQRVNLLGNSTLGRITAGEFQYHTSANYSDYTSFDGETAKKLYTAVCQDVDAGHFGINQFDNESWTRETYVNSISLYYTVGDNADDMDSCNINFSSNCTYLLAALEETGLLDDTHRLLTYEQMLEYDEKYAETYESEPAATDAIPTATDAIADETASVAVIGGADGPTAVFVAQ